TNYPTGCIEAQPRRQARSRVSYWTSTGEGRHGVSQWLTYRHDLVSQQWCHGSRRCGWTSAGCPEVPHKVSAPTGVVLNSQRTCIGIEAPESIALSQLTRRRYPVDKQGCQGRCRGTIAVAHHKVHTAQHTIDSVTLESGDGQRGRTRGLSRRATHRQGEL